MGLLEQLTTIPNKARSSLIVIIYNPTESVYGRLSSFLSLWSASRTEKQVGTPERAGTITGRSLVAAAVSDIVYGRSVNLKGNLSRASLSMVTVLGQTPVLPTVQSLR